MTTMPDKRYMAFISYSHADTAAARWLHRALETYRIPKGIRQQLSHQDRASGRLGRFFIDREEFSSSSDLAASVRAALTESEWLILVCSPSAARSRWVNEEVRTFKELGRGDRILCLIVAGAPSQGADSGENCFPPALRFDVVDGVVSEQRAAEPLGADIRSGRRAKGRAKLQIIAGLLRVPLDELRRREHSRRYRQLMLLAGAASIGCVTFALLAVYAWHARNEAERQRVVAVQKTATAERTAAFITSLFEVSDPSEARGNSITAREILDQGARQIGTSLKEEPLVRSEFAAVLGRVYYGLGLYGPASSLLTEARSVPGLDAHAAAQQSITLGDIEWARGDYAKAQLLYGDADRRIRLEQPVDKGLHARALIGLGDSASMLEHYPQANEYLVQALRIVDSNNADPEMRARVFESLGRTQLDSAHLDDANAWYTKALAARTALSGETHPKSLDILNDLGAIAYLKGNSKDAERYWSRLLVIDRRVRGPEHPEVAVTLNNLGRLRLERRQFAQALPMLEEARKIQAHQRNADQDDLLFALSNLARAKLGVGDYQGAQPLLLQALNAAQATNHRLLAPILTDLADLECRTRHYDAALSRLEAARPIMAQRYPEDPWRAALIDNVTGECFLNMNRLQAAGPMLLKSTPVILKKWAPDSLYGFDAGERLKRWQARLSASASP